MLLRREPADLLSLSSVFCVKRGYVLSIDATGEILVEEERDRNATVCEVLQITCASPPVVETGDKVLYLFDAPAERGYIFGRIGRTSKNSGSTSARLTLEASESIELRCGASAIILSRDGRLDLRAGDITSRASRINKIKGAAVKIN